MRKALSCLGLLASFATSALAISPPPLINYQGVLRDSANRPLTGTYDMVFRFFDVPAGGNAILVDSHIGGGGVVVSGGLFNAHLGGGSISDGPAPGTVTSLAEVFPAYAEVYLEVQVQGEVLAPRTRVLSSAYALAAGPSAPATGFFDDFNRPNSPDLGNGWIESEQTSADVQILGNEVRMGPNDQTAYPNASKDHGNLQLLPNESASLSFKFHLPSVNRTAYAGIWSTGGSQITGVGFNLNNGGEVVIRGNGVFCGPFGSYSLSAGTPYWAWVDYVPNGANIDINIYLNTTNVKPGVPQIVRTGCPYTPTNRFATFNVDAPQGGLWFFDDIRVQKN